VDGGGFLALAPFACFLDKLASFIGNSHAPGGALMTKMTTRDVMIER